MLFNHKVYFIVIHVLKYSFVFLTELTAFEKSVWIKKLMHFSLLIKIKYCLATVPRLAVPHSPLSPPQITIQSTLEWLEN